MLEFVFDVLGELLLQLIFQLVADLGAHTASPHRKDGPRSPVLSIIGHLVFGALGGGLSLLVLPHAWIHDPIARVAYLVLAPIAAGGATAGIGYLRRKREQTTVTLERFGYGYLLAFSFALVRFLVT